MLDLIKHALQLLLRVDRGIDARGELVAQFPADPQRAESQPTKFQNVSAPILKHKTMTEQMDKEELEAKANE